MSIKIWHFLWKQRSWIAIILAAVLLVLTGALAYKLYNSSHDRQALIDQLQQTQATYQLNEKEWQQQTIRAEGLAGLLSEISSDLSSELKKQKIAYVATTKIVTKTVTISGPGTTTVIEGPAECGKAVVRVDFKGDKAYAHVVGYTLSGENAAAHLEWTVDPIELTVVLSRNGDNYVTTFDTGDSGIQILAAHTYVDPSVFNEGRWAIAGNVGIPLQAGEVSRIVLGAQLFRLQANAIYGVGYLYSLSNAHFANFTAGLRF